MELMNISNQVLLYPVPIDITASFRKGTANAPLAINNVIHQLDESHPFKKTTPLIKMAPISNELTTFQSTFDAFSNDIILHQ